MNSVPLPLTQPFLPVENMSYEQAFHELEAIVSALENAEHPLEQALVLFERGQALSKYCSTLLDKAELKVRQIVGEELVDVEISNER